MSIEAAEILLIEDNQADIDYLKEIYFNNYVKQFNLNICRDIDSTLEFIGRKINLIFLDLDLPDSRGMDTFHAVKNSFSNVPIVVFSGRKDEEISQKVIQLGVHDFISKGSITENAINRIIRFSLARHQYCDKLKREIKSLSLVKTKLSKRISNFETDVTTVDFNNLRSPSKEIEYLSHEIRNPLSLMSGAIDILKSIYDVKELSHLSELEQKSLSEQNALLNTLRNSCEYINNLIEQNLEPEDEKPRSIASIIDEIQSLVQASMIIKNNQFKVKIDKECSRIDCQKPTKLKQIILNLVGNAIKYTSNGFITILCKYNWAEPGEKGFLSLEIQDTGKGIQKENIDKIFNEDSKFFVEGETGKSSGKGLFYVKSELETVFKSSINCVSVPDYGTTFKIILSMGCFEVQDNKLNIAVIDDCEDFSKIIHHYLVEYPSRISFFKTKDEASRAISEKRFDLIFCDYHLDGNQTTRDLFLRINKYQSEDCVKIILSGAKEGSIEIEESLYDSFLNKPIQKKSINKVVENIMKAKNMEV